MEKRESGNFESFKRQSPDEIDRLIWHKSISLTTHRAGLVAARKHFYDYEEFVEAEISLLNRLRALRNLEPLPSEMSLDLQEITRDTPDGLVKLEHRISEVERTFNHLCDAQSTLGEYHKILVEKRDELMGEQQD